MNVEDKFHALVKAAALMLHSSGDVAKVREVVFATAADAFSDDPLASTDEAVEYLRFASELEGGAGDVVGPYIGPFQFGELAWKESSSEPYWPGALYHDVAARAALSYYFLNRSRFWRDFPGRQYTKEIAYLYHNQGPGGAKHFLKKGELKWPKQSRKALETFSSI